MEARRKRFLAAQERSAEGERREEQNKTGTSAGTLAGKSAGKKLVGSAYLSLRRPLPIHRLLVLPTLV